MPGCLNETCTAQATITTPVSLCTPCAIETALAVLPLVSAKARAETNEPTNPLPVETVTSEERKTARSHQESATVALYLNLRRRPEWTEIREALIKAGLAEVSRPTAQRIRERVESAHPDLPRERRQTLTATN